MNRKVNIKRYKRQDQVSYTLGATLTIELLKKRSDIIQKIYIHSKMDSEKILEKVEEICNREKIAIEYNDKAFRILSDKENCFVIGEFRKFDCELDNSKKHIVLVSPSNSGNLGTIMRTAVGFGVKELAIIRPAVDIYDPKTIRASMGAIFNLNFRYFNSFEEYRDYAREREYFPFMLKGSLPLPKIRFPEPCSLIFGNEATGLSDEFLKIGQSVIIDHSLEIDSLNLPIAVSIALYEATKHLK
jgi:TrmH family RNA methyltransferase